MKKAVITVVVLGALAGGFFLLRRMRLQIDILDAKFGNVRRGDLVIPIKASGKIQPRGRREIKSKASGEIIHIPYEEGQMVRQGDVLVELKRDDEERNLETAQAALDQAEIALEMAQVTLEERRTVTIPAAEAAADQARAQFDRIDVEWKSRKALWNEGKGTTVSPEEWATIDATYREQKAYVARAEADVRQAKIAERMAAKDVSRNESAVLAAQRKFEDSRQRLDETLVRAPIDGMVLKRYRSVGEVIQSGTQSLTGGTVLMELADVSEVFMVASVDEADIGKVRELAPKGARPGADPRAATQPTTRDAISQDQAEAATTQELVGQDTIQEGTEVRVSVEAFPDEEFAGIIERISPESDLKQAVATFEVRIRIVSPNRDKLRHLVGMQAEAEFTSVPVRNVLLVPYEAIHRGPSDEVGVYVPVMNPDKGVEEPEFRACKLGPDNGIDVVVLSGVKEGDRIYTKLPVKTRQEEQAEQKSEDEK